MKYIQKTHMKLLSYKNNLIINVIQDQIQINKSENTIREDVKKIVDWIKDI